MAAKPLPVGIIKQPTVVAPRVPRLSLGGNEASQPQHSAASTAAAPRQSSPPVVIAPRVVPRLSLGASEAAQPQQHVPMVEAPRQQPAVIAPRVVPPLSLAANEMSQPQSQSQQQQQQSAAPVADGIRQASTRTRARAQLRKKARVRRREEAEREAADPYAMQGSAIDSLPLGADSTNDGPLTFAIHTARGEGRMPLTARSMNSSAYDIFTARRLQEVQEDEGESECSNLDHMVSNDEDACASSCDGRSDVAAFGLFCGNQAWDYPLTQEDKKTRVLLMCEREEALDDREIRRSRRQIEKLQGKVGSLREDIVRLRKERDMWKAKACRTDRIDLDIWRHPEVVRSARKPELADALVRSLEALEHLACSSLQGTPRC
eukprot:gnl/TRDRNA2_/TRDRNA2_43765_c0_seq1.p1 gnl/TRDRNA2_/TRDRNA2_43765_c0~~gnl/TRDRNA2_/TRDRNA2_43765_c0_seq1.p1  ORF type:complete len:376 (-),score=73.49 gnl/TRDRNA2_/TRDRNA2_43765_c0_seq1:144-1271(-)